MLAAVRRENFYRTVSKQYLVIAVSLFVGVALISPFVGIVLSSVEIAEEPLTFYPTEPNCTFANNTINTSDYRCTVDHCFDSRKILLAVCIVMVLGNIILYAATKEVKFYLIVYICFTTMFLGIFYISVMLAGGSAVVNTNFTGVAKCREVYKHYELSYNFMVIYGVFNAVFIPLCFIRYTIYKCK
jgi:hypothetical protein